jgi:hypothetical protein
MSSAVLGYGAEPISTSRSPANCFVNKRLHTLPLFLLICVYMLFIVSPGLL